MPNNENYRLRPIVEGDLDLLLRWRNSDRIRRNMFSETIIKMDEHRAWFHRLKENSNAVYLVFEFQLKPIGLIYFTDIDRKYDKCLWGFYLGEVNLPQGTGTKMGVLGLRYAFKTININKLYGEVFQFNTVSVKFFKRLGFFEEEYFVKHVLKNDKCEDVITFSLSREDWQRRREQLELIAFPGETR